MIAGLAGYRYPLLLRNYNADWKEVGYGFGSSDIGKVTFEGQLWKQARKVWAL